MTPVSFDPVSYLLKELSPEDRETTNASVCLRCSQERCDQFQNIRIALCGIVESRGIDENDRFSIEGKLIRAFDLSRGRLQAHSDP